MNHSYLPNDMFYTSKPANLKNLKEPALSKIYTYPIDKNIKWYKPFPEFPKADQDKYFFKYEYINAISRRINMLKQQLYMEQLREQLEDDTKMNEIKAEDIKIQQLNNYFKVGLFSTTMNTIKEKYLESQAKELAKNNTAVLDAEKQRADIRATDTQTLTLQSENANIKEELKEIDEKIANKAKKLLEDDDIDEVEGLKDELVSFLSKQTDPILSQKDREFINETLSNVGDIQDTELDELFKRIQEQTKEELQEEIEIKEELTERIKEKNKDFIELSEKAKKLEDLQIRKGDIKSKIQQQKNINDVYITELDKIRKGFMKYDKSIIKGLESKKDLVDNIILSNDLKLLSNQETEILINNFPNIKSSNAGERRNIKSNLNELFKTIRDGYKVDIKTFTDNIKLENLIDGLEKKPYNQEFTPSNISNLERDLKTYKKSPLSKLGLKTGSLLLTEGQNLQKQVEQLLNIDLVSLLPSTLPEGAIFEDKPPTTEVQSRAELEEEFEEEGGAF